jgi:hypothetical protein
MFISIKKQLAGFFNPRGFLMGHGFHHNMSDIIGGIPVVGFVVGVPRIIVGAVLFCFTPYSDNPTAHAEASKRLMHEGMINCIPFWNTLNLVVFEVTVTSHLNCGLSTVLDNGQYYHVKV